MPIEMVFFDVGETLVDVPSFLELFQIALQKHDLQVETPQLLRSIRLVLDELRTQAARGTREATEAADRQHWRDLTTKILAGSGLSGEVLPPVVESFLAYNLDPGMASPFDDSFRSLDALHDLGLRLGVISNWDWYLPDLLDAWGMGHYFDPVVASARVGVSKPNPVIFQTALAQAGVAADRCLQIGDRVDADVLGARDAGLIGVHLDRMGPPGIRYEPFDDGAGSYPVIDTLDLLPRLLDELTAEGEPDA